MTDQIEEVVEEVVPEVVVPVETEVIPPTEAEEKAAKMGWTPLEKFKGAPDKWRSAEEFIERGETMMPILKAQVKRQDKEIEELKQSMKQFGEYHTKTEARAYENALNTLRAQRAEAISVGDGATFDKVDEAIETLRKDMSEKEAKPQPNPDDNAVYKEWESRNKWVLDPVLNGQANAVAKFLRDMGEESVDSEFLDKVKEEIKKRNPDKFENPRRATVASVEGGVPTQRSGGKNYASLPADAKAACDRMAKNGFSGDLKAQAEFKVEFVKNYEWA